MLPRQLVNLQSLLSRCPNSWRGLATTISSKMNSSQPIVPPFNRETAIEKVQMAENLWNSMNAKTVSMAYTEDSIWRNRDQFFQGRKAIEEFLIKKWEKEIEYKLKKKLFAFEGNRIAVQFWYEYFNQTENSWKRTYGLEHWTFATDGLMQKRHMSGNEIPITEADRWFREGVEVDQVEIAERDVTSPLKALTFLATPLQLQVHRTFRLLPHVSSLPVNSFAQLLSTERTTAEHSFSQIVSELELDSKTNKWICKMRVSDFKKIKAKQPEEEEVEVFGEGDTSLEATN
ncbi:hypothetical protein JCM5350_003412, partial [Sporobolomyces pararoseus]